MELQKPNGKTRQSLPNLFVTNLVFLFVLIGCSETPKEDSSFETTTEETSIEFYGNTQGTTYAIICNDEIQITNEEIDQSLAEFDLALSAWIKESTLSLFNEAPAGEFEYDDPNGYFNRCYALSNELYNITNGNFDPTLFPIIDAWGFYNKNNTALDSSEVDSLLAFTGFRKGHLNFIYIEDTSGFKIPNNRIIKNTPQVKLDFNGIAQGLAVDVICEKLIERGAKNYYVEIGGEIRISGRNREGDDWRIGIDKPIENSTADEREITEIIQLTNCGIATSGSYRNFFESDGKTYSHTINPKTGWPVTHKLISATVVSNTCANADALATACMVMGPEKSIDFFMSDTLGLGEIYLIYENNKGRIETYASPGFQEFIVK